MGLAVSRVLVLRGTGGAGYAAPVLTVTLLAEVHDRYRSVDGRMRFTDRASIPVFSS